MSDLNPGIVRTVTWLQRHGFNTTDSGDGVTHDHPCDRPYPYVSMKCDSLNMVMEAQRLAVLLELAGVPITDIGTGMADPNAVVKPCIQATYDPGDGTAIIDLSGVRDEMLPENLP